MAALLWAARALNVNTAGPSGATIYENLKPSVEHYRMHEITRPPKSFLAMDPQSEPAGPSGATIQENKKLTVDHRPLHMITPTLASQSDQARKPIATIQDNDNSPVEDHSKPIHTEEFFDAGTPK